MLGLLISLAVAVCYLGLAMRLLDRILVGLDPAAKCGISGLLGLAIVGWATLPIGLIPGGLRWGGYVVIAGALIGGFTILRELSGAFSFRVPEGVALAGPLAVLPALGLSLLGALTPSTATDWDSLAYHLAVPKMWLASGQIQPVTFIHHSNFPFLVDNLNIWGLWWGGESGAKAFTFAFLVFGLISVFGLARQNYSSAAGWWAAISLSAVPAVVWESGTAYIDVANGLCAGIGAVLLLGQPRRTVLGGLLLGCAVASKYTGLQAVLALGLLLVVWGLWKKDQGTVRAAALAGVLALAVGFPWYLKNAVWTGNPVFPFFFERFGGKHWDQFAADIYREEQKTFGVPSDGPGGMALALPHAVLGIAYQPGRYNNPAPKLNPTDPPTGAQGNPSGAIGAALWAGALLWLVLGKAKRFEGGILLFVGISLGMWFVLSQQSRYVLALVPPLCILAGGAIVRLRAGQVLAVMTVLQAGYAAWFVKELVGSDQLKVVLGLEKPEAFAISRTGFFEPAQKINVLCKGGKVALFDEVFGYLLDVPYFWANPGHSTEMGYASLASGHEFADRLRALGITHVYINLSSQVVGSEQRARLVQAMGLGDYPKPFDAAEKASMDQDLRTKWRRLLAEAVASGELQLIQPFSSSLLFEVRKS